METNTKYFGTITYDEYELITFENGLYGFEKHKHFLLIQFAEDNEGLFCLQNIEDTSLAFIVVNPFAFLPTYKPELIAEDLKKLDAKTSTELIFYNICVLNNQFENSSVNLRCPLAINPENRHGIQVVLENTNYPFRQPLHKLAKEK